jgi:hypothetical protein
MGKLEEGMSAEDISKAAADVMKEGERIGEMVRDLTLRQLQTRRFDYAGTKEVIEAMTAGISLGAGQRANHVREAVADALSGLDQALMKSAQASQLALKEMAGRGRELSDGELKRTFEQMKKLESDFLAAVNAASQAAGSLAKTEMLEFLSHARRAGTDTGTVVAQTMREFSHRMAEQMKDAQGASLEAAQQLSARFVQAASGFLQGLAEALRSSSQKK